MDYYECPTCSGMGCESCGGCGKMSDASAPARPAEPREQSLDDVLEGIWDATKSKDDARLRLLLGIYKEKTGKDRPGFMS